MRIGYARVSTAEQNLDLQLDALKATQCNRIYEEHASGKNAERTELRNCLKALRAGFKHPSKYDAKFLLKPGSKANTKLILAEEDNIKHVFASLATKVTSQSVIIGKLSSYARKNRTKKALWELDNLHRSLYLLSYVDSPRLRRNVQRALNRGESYHKLVRAVAYANAGKLRVRTDLEQQLWSECSRLLANCVIYYNACVLSQLLEYAESKKDFELANRIKTISPVSWKHVNFYGKYHFRDTGEIVDFDQMISRLAELEWKSADAKPAK